MHVFCITERRAISLKQLLLFTVHDIIVIIMHDRIPLTAVDLVLYNNGTAPGWASKSDARLLGEVQLRCAQRGNL